MDVARIALIVTLLVVEGASAGTDLGASAVVERARTLERSASSEHARLSMSIEKGGKARVRLIERFAATDHGELRVVVREDGGDSYLFADGMAWVYSSIDRRLLPLRDVAKTYMFSSTVRTEQAAPHASSDYSYKLLGQETLDGVTVDVLEETPTYRSAFTRLVSRIDSRGRRLRVEYYQGERLTDIVKIQYADFGPHCRPASVLHEVVGEGRRTLITYSDWSFEGGLDASSLVSERLGTCCTWPKSRARDP